MMEFGGWRWHMDRAAVVAWSIVPWYVVAAAVLCDPQHYIARYEWQKKLLIAERCSFQDRRGPYHWQNTITTIHSVKYSDIGLSRVSCSAVSGFNSPAGVLGFASIHFLSYGVLGLDGTSVPLPHTACGFWRHTSLPLSHGAFGLWRHPFDLSPMKSQLYFNLLSSCSLHFRLRSLGWLDISAF
jgi:hypothetical protein